MEYYNAHPEPYRLMLAYYYLSRIQFNAGNYTPSILSAHKAQKHAENIGNYFFLGLIYRGMAATYNRLHNAREEVSNCTLAHQCFLQAHAHRHADFALIRTGHAHHNNHEYKKSIRIAQQAFETGYKKQDTLLLSESLHLLGSSLCAQQNTKRGKTPYSVYYLLLQTSYPTKITKISPWRILRKIGWTVSLFYQKRIKSNNPASSWIEYNLHNLKGNYPQALHALEIINNVQDSLIHHVLNQNISSTLTNYYKQEEELLKNKLQYEKINGSE